jgi:hypothetical protein
LTANFFTVHLNQSYAFNGAPPDSFEMLGGSDAFAQHGTLLADYPATTETLDLRVGMAIQLDGVDTTIENQNAFTGLASEFVAFVGNEIMSIIGSTLLADGAYKLNLARNRFGTERQAHSQGDEVFIVKQSSILKLQHPQIQAGNSVELKIAMQAKGASSDLADVAASTVALAGNVFNLPAPAALKVNGATVNASFNPADAMEIDWVLPVVAGIDMTKAYTLLEFIATGHATESVKIPWPLNSTAYTYGVLIISGTGGPLPAMFTLRASIVADDGWRIITGQSISLNVFKI